MILLDVCFFCLIIVTYWSQLIMILNLFVALKFSLFCCLSIITSSSVFVILIFLAENDSAFTNHISIFISEFYDEFVIWHFFLVQRDGLVKQTFSHIIYFEAFYVPMYKFMESESIQYVFNVFATV